MDRRHWLHQGPDRPRPQPLRASQDKKDEKELARATADIQEAERRVARQTVLIDEFRAQGNPTLEPAKALARLESELRTRRDRRKLLVARLAPAKVIDHPVASNT